MPDAVEHSKNCTKCKEPLTSMLFMCDEIEGEWCPVCWEAHECPTSHEEGCATAVFLA